MNVDNDSQTTGEIIGAAIAVHRDLGPGLDEATYEAALSHKLHSLDISHACQVPLGIRYRGTTLDCGYRYDLLVDSRLPVELKAVETVLPIHHAQLPTYLRLGSHPLGLLINFDVPALKDGIKRMAQSLSPAYTPLSPLSARVQLDAISSEILAGACEVHRFLGPGLLRSAYEECLCHELRLRGVPYVRQHSMPIEFEGRVLAQTASSPSLSARPFRLSVFALPSSLDCTSAGCLHDCGRPDGHSGS